MNELQLPPDAVAQLGTEKTLSLRPSENKAVEAQRTARGRPEASVHLAMLDENGAVHYVPLGTFKDDKDATQGDETSENAKRKICGARCKMVRTSTPTHLDRYFLKRMPHIFGL